MSTESSAAAPAESGYQFPITGFFRSIAVLVHADLVKLSSYWVIIAGYGAMVAIAVIGAYLFYLAEQATTMRAGSGWDFGINLVLRCIDFGAPILYVMVCILFSLEVSNKTIKYILTRPVTRVELILSKYVTATLMFALALVIFWVIALIAGKLTYGLGDLYQFGYKQFSAVYILEQILICTVMLMIPCVAIAAMALMVSTYSSTMGGAIIIGLIFWVFFQILGILPAKLGFNYTWQGIPHSIPYVLLGFPSQRVAPLLVLDSISQGEKIRTWLGVPWGDHECNWIIWKMIITCGIYFVIFFTASVLGVRKRDFTL
jgi:bacitracin transport system permease protein